MFSIKTFLNFSKEFLRNVAQVSRGFKAQNQIIWTLHNATGHRAKELVEPIGLD